MQISIDDTHPWLIEIGDDVQLTGGARILTHDFSWSVLKKKYGPVLGMAGKVKIGNNVFVGSDTTILGGTEIGNNVIIGAGSVIKGKIPDNCVAVGVPCKPVMSLDDFYRKRLEKQEQEAFVLVNEYIRHYGKSPTKEILHEFFFLFENGEGLEEIYGKKLCLCGNREESWEYLKKQEPRNENFEAFLQAAINSNKDI